MATQVSGCLGYPVVELPERVVSSAEMVIRFLVSKLVELGRISPDHASRAACQVETRERQGSTVLVTGVAVPHSKSEVPAAIGIIGRSSVAISWQSAGSAPVYEVCLLLLPANDPSEHMRALKEAVGFFSAQPSEA